jgi:hypothetical protein
MVVLRSSRHHDLHECRAVLASHGVAGPGNGQSKGYLGGVASSCANAETQEGWVAPLFSVLAACSVLWPLGHALLVTCSLPEQLGDL